MKPKPLKNKLRKHYKFIVGQNIHPNDKLAKVEDIKSAVEWLKHKDGIIHDKILIVIGHIKKDDYLTIYNYLTELDNNRIKAFEDEVKK